MRPISLQFFGQHAHSPSAKPLPPIWRRCARSNGIVYAKRPFGGPEAVLAYLSRYTHRVAIANRRLIASDDNSVTFSYKDYRIEGPARYKVMTLATDEFIRRFLMHVLPKGFHRIRHYGLFAKPSAPTISPAPASCSRIAHAERTSTAMPQRPKKRALNRCPCPCCGGRMIIIETFERGCQPKHRPPRQRSGSIPHDAVTADDQRPNTHYSCRLACRQRPSSHRSARFARTHTANRGRSARGSSFTPFTHPPPPKPIAATASIKLPQASRRGQIPIVPAAPPVPHRPRFRALALFERRPHQRVESFVIPAFKNLHNCRKDPPSA